MSRRLLKVLLACWSGLAQAQTDGLKHDPFARPVLAPRSASALPANAGNAPVPEPAWKPELRAIMAAGPNSIVNVEGVVVRIGEQINGYRLVEVHEETAVFVNNKKRVTLSLRGIEPLPNPPPRQDDRKSKQDK